MEKYFLSQAEIKKKINKLQKEKNIWRQQHLTQIEQLKRSKIGMEKNSSCSLSLNEVNFDEKSLDLEPLKNISVNNSLLFLTSLGGHSKISSVSTLDATIPSKNNLDHSKEEMTLINHKPSKNFSRRYRFLRHNSSLINNSSIQETNRGFCNSQEFEIKQNYRSSINKVPNQCIKVLKEKKKNEGSKNVENCVSKNLFRSNLFEKIFHNKENKDQDSYHSKNLSINKNREDALQDSFLEQMSNIIRQKSSKNRIKTFSNRVFHRNTSLLFQNKNNKWNENQTILKKDTKKDFQDLINMSRDLIHVPCSTKRDIFADLKEEQKRLQNIIKDKKTNKGNIEDESLRLSNSFSHLQAKRKSKKSFIDSNHSQLNETESILIDTLSIGKSKLIKKPQTNAYRNSNTKKLNESFFKSKICLKSQNKSFF